MGTMVVAVSCCALAHEFRDLIAIYKLPMMTHCQQLLRTLLMPSLPWDLPALA